MFCYQLCCFILFLNINGRKEIARVKHALCVAHIPFHLVPPLTSNKHELLTTANIMQLYNLLIFPDSVNIPKLNSGSFFKFKTQKDVSTFKEAPEALYVLHLMITLH